MIRGLGTDIVEISRVRNLLDRFGDRFLRRVLGSDEFRLFLQRADREQFVAGRFAAKEALVKALAAFLEHRPRWYEMQVLPDASGQPRVHLPEPVREQLGRFGCLVSISHERQYAVAVVIVSDGGDE